MLFHEFQKVPQFIFKRSWISVRGEQNYPLKNMEMSPEQDKHTHTHTHTHTLSANIC